MGVQLIENDLYDDDDYDYECSTCFSFATNSSATKNQTLNSTFKKQPNQQEHQKAQQHHLSQQAHSIFASKDLVGNSKEFRIESNKCNLRIIGNGNRIRIANNSGNIQIIGNSTRLKITENSGNIKYTGNEGRISLGNESTQQTVDYIGCNGLLKVVNSTELNKSPRFIKNNSHTSKSIISDKVNNNNKQRNLPGNATLGTSPRSSTSTSSPLKPRVKSASFDELDMKHEKWQHFNDFLQHEGWQHFTKVSLPNLKENFNEPCNCECKCTKNQNKSLFNNLNKTTYSKNSNNNSNKSSSTNVDGNKKGINISNNRNVSNTFGEIVIKNSVNVSIAKS